MKAASTPTRSTADHSINFLRSAAGIVLAGSLFWLFAAPAADDTGSAPDPAVPVGAILPFAGPTNNIPESGGWLLCDGREVAVAEYQSLFGVLGYAWGQERGGSAFRIPDLRGLFLRGVAHAAGSERDPGVETRLPISNGGNAGNQVGSIQDDAMESHVHYLAGTAVALGPGTTDTAQHIRFYAQKGSAGDPDQFKTVSEEGGSETRPRNAYVNWIIKAR